MVYNIAIQNIINKCRGELYDVQAIISKHDYVFLDILYPAKNVFQI